MEILLGVILIIAGAAVAWGGFSGKMPKMIQAITG